MAKLRLRTAPLPPNLRLNAKCIDGVSRYFLERIRSQGSDIPKLVMDRKLVERLRLGRGKDHGEVVVAPGMDSWSAGDLAREGFGQCSGDLYKIALEPR
jgi:hypothetical protein